MPCHAMATVGNGYHNDTPPTFVGVPGIRNKDFEEAVANNSTIYAINAVVLASFAGLAAYNPGVVSALEQCHKSFAEPKWPSLLKPSSY